MAMMHTRVDNTTYPVTVVESEEDVVKNPLHDVLGDRPPREDSGLDVVRAVAEWLRNDVEMRSVATLSPEAVEETRKGEAPWVSLLSEIFHAKQCREFVELSSLLGELGCRMDIFRRGYKEQITNWSHP